MTDQPGRLLSTFAISDVELKDMTRYHLHIGRLCLATLGTCCLLAGCGGNDSAPVSADTSGGESGSPTTSSSDSGGQTSDADTEIDRPRRQNEIWTDAEGRKYLGKVPFDAFYDQPYTVATNRDPIDGTAPGVSPSNGGMGTPVGTDAVDTPAETPTTPENPTTVEDTPAGGGWDELIPIEVLDSEVTTVRNFLNATLQSVGSYNSSMLMIPPKTASLAVLAGIATEHPGKVAWKEEALYIRDLAKRMNEGTLQRGKKDQVRLLELFENMTDTFNNSRPAGLPEPPAEDGFSDVAEMRLVMMRMEQAQKKMTTEAGSEAGFTSKKDMIRHEAAILLTLTHVIALDAYGYGDDTEFTGYAKTVMDSAREIKNATEADDFNTYQLALSKISTTCQQCHSVYKNN